MDIFHSSSESQQQFETQKFEIYFGFASFNVLLFRELLFT